MKVREVMSSPVITTSPRASIRSALEQMHSKQVRVIPVVAGHRVVGIVTDSAILRGCLPGAKAETPVRRVMMRDPLTCRADEDAAQVMALMRQHGLRRLPVLDGAGTLVGLLASCPLLGAIAADPAGQAPCRATPSQPAASGALTVR